MFLSKKNAIYFNKSKNLDPKKSKRILAGWQDQQEDKQDKYDFATTTPQVKTMPMNLLQGDQLNNLISDVPVRKQGNSKFYLSWDQLAQKGDIQCQKRLVEEIVQPGGIRIKPNDTMLNNFLKEIKGMQAHIIGSLLLSKIEVNYPFQTKAKVLYTIEYLVKKNQTFLSYFKAHVQKLREFPEPQDNVENYRKILKSVLNFIGVAVQNTNAISEQPKPKYVDPGYNDDPKSLMSNFIQQNVTKPKKTENKKVIIGPGQMKQKAPVEKKQPNNSDFLVLDLLGSASNRTQCNPKQQKVAQQSNRGQLSFEQILSGINFNNSPQPQRTSQKINFLL